MPPGLPVTGVVLADHILSLDVRRHPARLAATLPDEVVAAVKQLALPLVPPSAAS